MRSLGISIRPDGFDFAICDGTLKKYSVAAAGSGLIPTDSTDPARDLGKALAAALKSSGATKYDRLTVAAPSLDSPLRELSLPFSDRDKIMQVLKFEVESEIYHFEIDELVSDYVELHDDRATTTLLVASEPKTSVQTTLDALAAAGLDASVLDLDYGSLCAMVSRLPQAEEQDPELAELSVAEQADVLHGMLHVGPYASILMAYSARGVRAVRVLHVGYRELGKDLSDEQAQGGPPEIEAEVVESDQGAPQDSGEGELAASETEAGETPDGDADGEAAEDEDLDLRDSLYGVDGALPTGLTVEQMLERASAEAVATFRKRLVTEVRRGLLASSLNLRGLAVVGAQVPGLDEQLQQRIGVATRVVELESNACPIAVGAALRGLGEKASVMNFRQEEFRFTKGLERIEGPLTFALVCLVAYFVLAGVVDFKVATSKKTAAASLDPERGSLLQITAKKVDELLNQDLQEDAPDDWRVTTNYEGRGLPLQNHIVSINNGVKRASDSLDELLGTGTLEMPQSCLDAWRLVSDVLKRELDGDGRPRWMLEELSLQSIKPRQRTAAHVEVKFRISILGTGTEPIRVGDNLVSEFKNQAWNLNNPILAGWEPVEVGEGRSQMITLSVSTQPLEEQS